MNATVRINPHSRIDGGITNEWLSSIEYPYATKSQKLAQRHMCVCGFSQKMTLCRELRMETNGPSVRVGEKRTEGKRNDDSGISINRVFPDK